MLAPDVPFPPNRGGRADVWRRLCALRSLGHSVLLIFSCESEGASAPTSEALRQIEAQVDGVLPLTIPRGLLHGGGRLATLPWRPWHVACRSLNQDRMDRAVNVVRSFRPDFVWTEGPWMGGLARELSHRLSLQLIYRSHNIEHQYMRGQARTARAVRDKLAWTMSCVGLERYETNLMREASAVLDISVEDLEYWRSRDVRNLHWLPPLPDPRHSVIGTSGAPPLERDVLFLGNLRTPNNVRGVEFLVRDVAPRIEMLRPGTRITVAGSRPTRQVRALVDTLPHAELVADPAEAADLLYTARVLVNPVRSGGGVQVKMLDMLMTDVTIVTSVQGTRGLPQHFASLFHITDDPRQFAEFVCQGLDKPGVDLKARVAARQQFGVCALKAIVDAIGRR